MTARVQLEQWNSGPRLLGGAPARRGAIVSPPCHLLGAQAAQWGGWGPGYWGGAARQRCLGTSGRWGRRWAVGPNSLDAQGHLRAQKGERLPPQGRQGRLPPVLYLLSRGLGEGCSGKQFGSLPPNWHTNVYSSFIHNCRKLEATKMSFSR